MYLKKEFANIDSFVHLYLHIIKICEVLLLLSPIQTLFHGLKNESHEDL